MQVTVNGLLVQGQVVAEHIVQDVRQNHGAEEPDVSAETAKRHQACRVAHSARCLGCTRHGGMPWPTLVRSAVQASPKSGPLENVVYNFLCAMR